MVMKSKVARLTVGGVAGIALVLATGTQAQAGVLGTGTFYEHADYGGASKQFGGGSGECVNVTSDWVNRISSFKAWYRVKLYSAANCWEDAGLPSQTYDPQPGLDGYSWIGATMNDRTKSMRVSG